MYPKVCFYYEPELDSIPTDLPLMDTLAASFGFAWIAIDRGGVLRPSDTIFTSLADARSAHTDHDWFFFYDRSDMPQGTVYESLQKVVHPPKKDVVYAVGSNIDGFDGQSPDDLRLRTQDGIVTVGGPRGMLWSAVVVSVIAYDRWSKENA